MNRVSGVTRRRLLSGAAAIALGGGAATMLAACGESATTAEDASTPSASPTTPAPVPTPAAATVSTQSPATPAPTTPAPTAEPVKELDLVLADGAITLPAEVVARRERRLIAPTRFAAGQRAAPLRAQPPFAGSDRQWRGRILAALRHAGGPLRTALLARELAPSAGERTTVRRLLAGLCAEGLAWQRDGSCGLGEAPSAGSARLPAASARRR